MSELNQDLKVMTNKGKNLEKGVDKKNKEEI